jgi:hypothetical protein
MSATHYRLIGWSLFVAALVVLDGGARDLAAWASGAFIATAWAEEW